MLSSRLSDSRIVYDCISSWNSSAKKLFRLAITNCEQFVTSVFEVRGTERKFGFDSIDVLRSLLCLLFWRYFSWTCSFAWSISMPILRIDIKQGSGLSTDTTSQFFRKIEERYS